MDDLRELDIKIARALGYRVEQATLYTPGGTLLGGDYAIHSGSKAGTAADDQRCWQTYTPHFTEHVDYAVDLLVQIHQRYGIDHVIYNEGDLECCDIGHWSKEPGERDQVWSGEADELALAICRAVEKCELVMGGR